MASEMGLGVIPWSPLGRGVLAGKYSSRDLDHGGDSATVEGTRLGSGEMNGSLTERSLATAEVVKTVATELGRTPLNDSVTAPLIARARLEQASTVALGSPHEVLSRPSTMAAVFGDTKVAPRRPRAEAAR
jgi:aryl-alcohol dehydrogenase-like predicted oxidoreductase